MQEERSRAVAKAMADLLMSIAPIKGDNIGELSLAHALGLGFLMVIAGAKPQNPTSKVEARGHLVPSLAASPKDTAILEMYFRSIILKSEAAPDELLSEFESMCERLRDQKRLNVLLRKAVKSSKPTERMGRPAKISQSNWLKFVQLSQQLLPLCIALGRLQRTSKKRTLKEQLDFLEPDYPQQVKFLMKHTEQVKSVLTDNALLVRYKTPKTRAEKLSDIFAGFAFGVSPRYAMQQALAAKRGLRGKNPPH
jgi:hypothetical protein